MEVLTSVAGEKDKSGEKIVDTETEEVGKNENKENMKEITGQEVEVETDSESKIRKIEEKNLASKDTGLPFPLKEPLGQNLYFVRK